MAARQNAQLGERGAQGIVRLPGENLLRIDAVASEQIERQIKLPARYVPRQAVQHPGDAISNAGIQA